MEQFGPDLMNFFVIHNKMVTGQGKFFKVREQLGNWQGGQKVEFFFTKKKSTAFFILSLKALCPLVLRRRFFLNFFNHIWALQPCWSFDPDHLNKFSLPLPLGPYMKLVRIVSVFHLKCWQMKIDETTEPVYPLSSPGASGSGVLNILTAKYFRIENMKIPSTSKIVLMMTLRWP